MIKSFKDKGLKEFAATGKSSKISVQNPDRILRILKALQAAKKPEDMNLPGLAFHTLKGNRKGVYSVSASGNWRITFRFDGEDAIDVDMEDYHKK